VCSAGQPEGFECATLLAFCADEPHFRAPQDVAAGAREVRQFATDATTTIGWRASARIPRDASPVPASLEESAMMTILVVLAALMLLGALPAWPHSRRWGYYPGGGLGSLVLILLVLVATGRL
jgi:hypothetical protein